MASLRIIALFAIALFAVAMASEEDPREKRGLLGGYGYLPLSYPKAIVSSPIVIPHGYGGYPGYGYHGFPGYGYHGYRGYGYKGYGGYGHYPRYYH